MARFRTTSGFCPAIRAASSADGCNSPAGDIHLRAPSGSTDRTASPTTPPGEECAMKPMLSCSRTVLLAALAAGLVAAAGPLAAQQPAVNPSPPTQAPVPPAAQPGAGPGSQTPGGPAAQAPTTPPPSWQQGRPEGEGAVKLAPVPALPIATAL